MRKSNTSATYAVATINHIDLLIVENGQKIVPIKPICDILGIDMESQRKKIRSDEILGSVAVLKTATGSDGKQYVMYCLPLEFVFGWLFTINADRVAPEARESVIGYKLECYKALYNHFTLYSRFVEYQQKMVEAQLQVVDTINRNFSTAKDRLHQAKEELNRRRAFTFEEFAALPQDEQVETLELVLEEA